MHTADIEGGAAARIVEEQGGAGSVCLGFTRNILELMKSRRLLKALPRVQRHATATFSRRSGAASMYRGHTETNRLGSLGENVSVKSTGAFPQGI